MICSTTNPTSLQIILQTLTVGLLCHNIKHIYIYKYINEIELNL